MPIVTNRLAPVPPRRRVVARLVAPVGWHTGPDGGSRETVTAWETTIADDGTWSLELPASASFTADNTFYKISEPGAAHAVTVPAGAGPYSLQSIAIFDPSTPSCCPPPPAGSVGDGARTLEELLDVEGTAAASPGDVLTRSVDGPWRPAPIPVPAGGYRHTQAAPALLVQVPHGLSFTPAGVLCTDTLGQLTEPDRITNPLLGITEVMFGAPFVGDIAVS